MDHEFEKNRIICEEARVFYTRTNIGSHITLPQGWYRLSYVWEHRPTKKTGVTDIVISAVSMRVAILLLCVLFECWNTEDWHYHL